jgi:hypothetical protein
MTKRLAFVVSVVVLAALLSPARADAQAPGAGAGPAMPPPLPLAVDLAKVPVGTWAEYGVLDGGGSKMTMRMALVGRTGPNVDLETRMSGASLGAMGQATMRLTMPSGTGATTSSNLKDLVIQMGDSEPMMMPPNMAAMRGQAFSRPDPKKRVGSEKVTVPAGTFDTQHYRNKGPAGETVDVWVSKEVPPFGLVKQTSVGIPGSKGPLTIELASKGGDAKRTITKTPRPFDVAALMKQIQAVPSPSTGNKGTPAPAPAPAPAGKPLGPSP